VRGKGKFLVTEYVPTARRSTRSIPLILTTGRILSQYNVGAQTRRTENNRWHDEDRLEIHPHDAEERGIAEGDWVGIASRAGETVLRAKVTERVQPGVVYTTFHFPRNPAPTSSRRTTRTGRPTAPSTRSPPCRRPASASPAEWQKRFREFSEPDLLQCALDRSAAAAGG
jgi:formate dehydrogenase major subunit